MHRAWLLLFVTLALPACSVSVSAGASGSASVGDAPAEAQTAQASLDWWPARERVFEDDDGWVLPVVLDTGGSAAPAGKLPLRFELDMRVFYEESDIDGQMVTRALPVQDAFTHSVTQHVCFRSAQTADGRFMVPIRIERSEGFRPGEYDVKVVRLDTDEPVGQIAQLTLLRR